MFNGNFFYNERFFEISFDFDKSLTINKYELNKNIIYVLRVYGNVGDYSSLEIN